MGWFFFAQASAPAPQVPAGWQDIVADYGLSGSLAVLFVVMAWRYVPRVIESAIKLNERLGQAVEENAKSQLRMSIAIRKISRVVSGNSDAVRGHPFSSTRVEQALLHMADCVESLTREDAAMAARLAPHLKAIREAVAAGGK